MHITLYLGLALVVLTYGLMAVERVRGPRLVSPKIAHAPTARVVVDLQAANRAQNATIVMRRSPLAAAGARSVAGGVDC